MTGAAAWASRLERVLEGACGCVLALMLGLVVTTTAQRYLFGTGHLGAEEAAIWLLLLLACVGFPLAASGALSMRIDLFAGRATAFRAVMAEAVVLAACLALVSAGIKAAMQVGGTSPLLGLGEWMRPAALAASGAAALVLRMLTLAGNGDGRVLLSSGLLATLGFALATSGISFGGLPPSWAAALVIALAILVAAPLPHAFILAGHLALAFGSPLVEPALGLSLLSGAGRHLLLAIPFFLLTGGLLIASGMARGLIRLAASLVGGWRGGLGQTVLLTSVLFSGISGSSIANAAFGAKTFVPPLVENGYTPERAGGLVAATAVLDNIIPPSIAFFILAAATGLPVGKLLVGGLVAGLVLAAALALAIGLTARRQPSAGHDAPPFRARFLLDAVPVLGLGLVVVAGIRFGIVTPTEAAGLAAAYTLCAAFAARAGLSGIAAAFNQVGAEAASVLMLIGAATPIAFLLAVDGVAAAAAGFALSLGENPLAVMLAANLLLLAAGLVLDIGAAILLFSPILLPVAIAAGIDPVAFGVVLVVNLMIGGLTPPVGILVQVVGATTGVPVLRLFRAAAPYLAALLGALFAMSLAIAAHASLSAS